MEEKAVMGFLEDAGAAWGQDDDEELLEDATGQEVWQSVDETLIEIDLFARVVKSVSV